MLKNVQRLKCLISIKSYYSLKVMMSAKLAIHILDWQNCFFAVNSICFNTLNSQQIFLSILISNGACYRIWNNCRNLRKTIMEIETYVKNIFWFQRVNWFILILKYIKFYSDATGALYNNFQFQISMHSAMWINSLKQWGPGDFWRKGCYCDQYEPVNLVSYESTWLKISKLDADEIFWRKSLISLSHTSGLASTVVLDSLKLVPSSISQNIS